MSKKKWLLAITIIIVAAWTIYTLNLIPQWTYIVNLGIGFLLGTYTTSPGILFSGIGATVTAVSAAAKLLYDRGKSGLTGTYNLLVGEKDRQLNSLSDAFGTVKTNYESLEGQFNTLKTELQSTKTVLADTQQKLADATAQIQRKQDQINAVTAVKATALSQTQASIRLQDVMRQLDQSVSPTAIKSALEAAGFTVTLE